MSGKLVLARLGYLSLWLTLLLPTAVYAWGHVPIGRYHVHPGYLTIAVVLVILISDTGNIFTFFKKFMAYVSQTPFLMFGFLALSGLFSVALSAEPKVGLLYYAWTMVTVFLIPLTVLVLHQKLGSLIFYSIGIYFFINGSVILWDLAMSNLGNAHWILGRVNSDPTLVGPLYRAYAWNFEPSYQAATGLMAALWIRLAMIQGSFAKRVERIAGWFIYSFILVSILATTSRTAFFGVPILLGFDFLFLFAGRVKAYRASRNVALLKPRRGLVAVIIFFLLLGSLVPLLLSKNLRSYVNFLYTRSITNPMKEGSFVIRFIDMRMAVEVFLDHPWFGAGPGQAKKLYFAHPETYKVSGLISRSETYEKSSGPIGNSVYTELLSEWGIAGFTAYLFGIFFMFWKTKAAVQWRLWPILGLLYFTTGSLPRMDLWLYVGLCWSLFHASGNFFKDKPEAFPNQV